MRAALIVLAAAIFAPARGHAQWEIEESHTTASLRGIHNVGGGVAWASGTNGTVLRTEDGGYLWQTCSIPPGAEKLDFRGIQAFDENTAIVMSSGPGDQSRLYKTTDGCQTWKLLFTNPDKDGFWDALIAKDADNAYVLGDPVNGEFQLFCKLDDDPKWSACWNEHSIKANKGEGAFAASNSSLLDEWDDGMMFFGTGGTEGARIFTNCDPCTEHFAKAWNPRVIPAFGRTNSAGIFSIAGDQPRSGMHLVAVGGDYLKPEGAGEAVYTNDRLHWKPARTPPHGYRSAVAYDSATKTWITVGPNGTDISTDDGRNWRPLTPTPQDAPDADKNWNALSLPFVVGPKGRIGKLRANALIPPAASTSKAAKKP